MRNMTYDEYYQINTKFIFNSYKHQDSSIPMKSLKSRYAPWVG